LSKRKAVGIGCFLSLFLLASFAVVQRTSATPNPSSAFVISPSSELVSVNDNFTITINLTNVQSLFCWQVILKYDESGLRLNELWVPEDNVFAGHKTEIVPASNGNPDFMGACLFGNDFVDVSNGVLCQANFAVLTAGQWAIEVAEGAHNSFWLSSSLVAEYPLSSNCTVFAVNETVNTGKIGTTLPLNSTSFLSLENFTVSSVSNVSSLSFDPSISELSFRVDLSASEIDAFSSGIEVNITVPASIFENASLICTLNVDGKRNFYVFIAPSTLGLFGLLQGSHVVTLDIGYIDPLSTVPEFSLPTILLPLVMLAFLVVMPRTRMFKTRQV
jgi:hypothetical protein